ncbi:MAG: hypothetical protein KIT84_06825 [Labilithrix sp.]|nr:hypothetical protein [Labilithrix sp.]MCW5810707.1 hypothetical protein [Labilithrix sp.]
MSALLLAAACQLEVPLAGAIATAHRTEEGIAWDARYVVNVDAVADFQGGRIPLAVPLPPGELLRATPGVTAITEDDRVTALCVEPLALEGRTIRVSFMQPAALGPGRTVPLGAPIAAGITVQIIDAHAKEDLRLDAMRGGTLEPHVGFLAARGIGHDAREEARRLTNAPPIVSRTAVYVRGADVHAAGGLEGRIGSRARERGTVIGVALAFVAVVAALVAAAKKLRRAATLERADALLVQEIQLASERATPPARAASPSVAVPERAASLSASAVSVSAVGPGFPEPAKRLV